MHNKHPWEIIELCLYAIQNLIMPIIQNTIEVLRDSELNAQQTPLGNY
jgi:hypothetical protein